MIIQVNEGCTSYATYIDAIYLEGTQEGEGLTQQLRKKLSDLIYLLPDEYLIDIIRDLAKNYGRYRDLGYCEQCGDYSSEYILDTEEVFCND